MKHRLSQAASLSIVPQRVIRQPQWFSSFQGCYRSTSVQSFSPQPHQDDPVLPSNSYTERPRQRCDSADAMQPGSLRRRRGKSIADSSASGLCASVSPEHLGHHVRIIHAPRRVSAQLLRTERRMYQLDVERSTPIVWILVQRLLSTTARALRPARVAKLFTVG